MAMTMAEKIMARAADVSKLSAGEYVDCKLDAVMAPFPKTVMRILEVAGLFPLLKQRVETEHLA